MNLTDELQQLREQDADLALILDTFATIDHVYRQSLMAMGQVNEDIPTVKSSAEITFSVDASTSTASHLIVPENK
jgi:hypothetical protein